MIGKAFVYIEGEICIPEMYGKFLNRRHVILLLPLTWMRRSAISY